MEDTTVNAIPEVRTKFCKYCGGKIHEDAVLCLHCGRQVEEVKKAEQPNIVINNSNQNVNSNTNIAGMYGGRLKNKWISFFLCLFLGFLAPTSFTKAEWVWGFSICLPVVFWASVGLSTVLHYYLSPILIMCGKCLTNTPEQLVREYFYSMKRGNHV